MHHLDAVDSRSFEKKAAAAAASSRYHVALIKIVHPRDFYSVPLRPLFSPPTSGPVASADPYEFAKSISEISPFRSYNLRAAAASRGNFARAKVQTRADHVLRGGGGECLPTGRWGQGQPDGLRHRCRWYALCAHTTCVYAHAREPPRTKPSAYCQSRLALPTGIVYVPLQCISPGRVNTPTENVHYFIKPRPSLTDPAAANLPTIATLGQYKQFSSLTTLAGLDKLGQGSKRRFSIGGGDM